MYYVNKIIGWMLSPLGMMFLAFGFAWLLSRTKRFVSLGKVIVALALALTWILGCGITTRFIGVPLEGDEIDWNEDAECKVDAIVLLGGGMGAHAECGRAEMFSGADRVWEAARKWKCLSAANGEMRIFTSGGSVETSTVPLLLAFGVSREAIACLDEPRNTEEEAAAIAGSGVKRILLVTSAWHMPRAKMLFERSGLEVVEAPTDYEMHFAAEEPVQIKDFFPSAETLQRNAWALKEWVARAFYYLKYRG